MKILRICFLASVSAVIAVLMLYCMITERELYPFAPYTMYSFRQQATMAYYQIYFYTGKERIAARPELLYPLDEARFKTSIEETIDSKAQTLEKLRGLYENYGRLRHLNPRLQRFDGVLLTRENWGSLPALRKGIPETVDEVATYAP